MNPTARALATLEIIQGSPGITAERIAMKLGTTERAVRRYVDTLREAGIPIEAIRGPYGGYRIGRSLRLAPLVFTAAEALGLVMAVLDGHHDVADPTGLVGSAFGKLVRALPETVAAPAEAVRQAITPAPDPAAARPDPTITSELVAAQAEGRRVRIRYRSEAGSDFVTDIDPWAIVVRHSRWYLLCWSHTANARRAYRLDRIAALDATGERSTSPPDLDPAQALEEHLSEGWEYTTEVLIDAPAEVVAARAPRRLGRVEPVSADRCRLVGSTSNPWWYAEQLTAVPTPFRVVGGPELRHCVRTLGQRLLASVASDE